MLNAILNNPYHILGVYANSPKKEQIANKGKMQAFLRVGRTMDFPLDLKGILPEVARTQQAVDLADSELALPADQVKHAQFWFVNVTPIDGIAFNHLLQGDLEAAICLWQKQTNASSLQNLFVAYLIKEDYIDAINLCAAPLYNNYAADFIKAIDENAAVKPTQLMEAVADTLTAEKVNSAELISDIKDKDWASLLENKAIAPIVENLERDVEEAKKVDEKDADARLQAGNTLMEKAKPLLDSLSNIISTTSNRYQLIVDKVCHEVLNCTNNYYNQTQDYEKAAKSLHLYKFAKEYAVGSNAKKRAETDYNTVRNTVSYQLPQEVIEEVKEIERIIKKYQKKKTGPQEDKNGLIFWEPFWIGDNFETAEKAIKMLNEASKHLVAIKENIGHAHNAYINISTKLAHTALNFVIEDVNRAMRGEITPSKIFPFNHDNFRTELEKKQEKAYNLKKVLAQAWNAILLMDYLDLEQDFKINRYLPSRKKLYEIIDDANGFNRPDNYYILTGCAYNIHVENIFLTDNEFFATCKYISDYERYLKKYPNGLHKLQAWMKVEKHLFDSCKNISDYNKYLKRYPRGIYVAQAKKKIEDLVYNACIDINSFQYYLIQYPKGKYAIQAQKKIEELVIIRAKQKRKRIIQAISLITLLLISSIIGLFAYVMSYPIYDQETGEELPLLEQIKWTFGSF